MNLPPFLLDRWLDQKSTADPPIEYDLAASTGPVWTLQEVLDVAAREPIEHLLDAPLVHTPTSGSLDLRRTIAELQRVDPDEV